MGGDELRRPQEALFSLGKKWEREKKKAIRQGMAFADSL
jgi:hypothetical protein